MSHPGRLPSVGEQAAGAGSCLERWLQSCGLPLGFHVCGVARIGWACGRLPALQERRALVLLGGRRWCVSVGLGLCAWALISGFSCSQGHVAPVVHVGWSFDGQLLASADCDGVVIVWRRERPAPVT